MNRCGLTGKDVCGCQGAVPRPKPLPRINFQHPQVSCVTIPPPPAFKPIGDACGCGNRVVRPAAQSRPPCPNKPGSCGCKAHTTSAPSCGCAEKVVSFENSAQDGATIYFEAKKKVEP